MIVVAEELPRLAGCGMQKACCIHYGVCAKVFLLSCVRAAVPPGRCLDSCSVLQGMGVGHTENSVVRLPGGYGV